MRRHCQGLEKICEDYSLSSEAPHGGETTSNPKSHGFNSVPNNWPIRGVHQTPDFPAIILAHSFYPAGSGYAVSSILEFRLAYE